jgi:hypothetical protein
MPTFEGDGPGDTAVWTSKASVNLYQNTLLYTPKVGNFQPCYLVFNIVYPLL